MCRHARCRPQAKALKSRRRSRTQSTGAGAKRAETHATPAACESTQLDTWPPVLHRFGTHRNGPSSVVLPDGSTQLLQEYLKVCVAAAPERIGGHQRCRRRPCRQTLQ